MSKELFSEEWCRKYLSSELNKEETQIFEQRLKDDEAFAEQVASEVVKHHERIALKKRIQTIANVAAAPQPSNSFTQIRWLWPIAAVLLVALGIYYLWPSPKTAYDYFEPYRVTTIARSSEGNATLDQALNYYQQDQFSEAIPLLTGLLGQQVLPDYMIHFYLGNCFLGQIPADPAQAVEEFNIVLSSDNDFHQPSEWYLSLAYALNGEVEAAEGLLKTIARDTGAYQHKAQKALQTLP